MNKTNLLSKKERDVILNRAKEIMQEINTKFI